jgi:hypothetical protein
VYLCRKTGRWSLKSNVAANVDPVRLYGMVLIVPEILNISAKIAVLEGSLSLFASRKR